MPHKNPETRRAWRKLYQQTERYKSLDRARHLRECSKRVADMRAYRYHAWYGITVEDFDQLLAKQGGGCALCGKPAKRRLCVDHDHMTGRVRGLLCSQGNSALGKLGDSVAGLERALTYLRGPS